MSHSKTTTISDIEGSLVVFGKPIQAVMLGSWIQAYASAVGLSDPTPQKLRLLESMVLALVDFGLAPHSTRVCRIAANAGASLQSSLAAGMLCFGERHAVIEGVTKMLSDKRIAETKLAHRERVPGFGHPIYKNDGDDSRIDFLIEMAQEFGFYGENMEYMRTIENRIKVSKKRDDIRLNIAGVCGAIWMDLGLPSELSVSLFIFGRSLGMTAHYLEQIRDGQFYIPEGEALCGQH